MRKFYPFLYGFVFAVITIAAFLIGCGGGGSSSGGSSGTTSCSAGYFSCGSPAGGPACCPTGDSCCFGYNLCCKSTTPHLGVRRSDNAKRCYQTLQDEGVTWDLLTVCGVPVR